ncbi:DUF6176 family protein [Streptomyces sp. enrichment culture]|uniref:DUF6176 family protein n=1 Tax=Streptomyces sp. enrichment culture TaxID=1795815 RepID=UPI003F54EE74
MHTRCIRIRLRPGTADRAAEWLRDFERRKEESLEAMRYSGMVWESAFLDRGPEGDEVLLVQCSHDFERTSRAFLGSSLKIDVEARAVLQEIAAEFRVPETLVQLVADDQQWPAAASRDIS